MLGISPFRKGLLFDKKRKIYRDKTMDDKLMYSIPPIMIYKITSTIDQIYKWKSFDSPSLNQHLIKVSKTVKPTNERSCL